MVEAAEIAAVVSVGLVAAEVSILTAFVAAPPVVAEVVVIVEVGRFLEAMNMDMEKHSLKARIEKTG